MIDNPLLQDIESFLAETGMGPSYFGKLAAKNSEIVGRLRDGRRVWPETEDQIRSFIETERRRRSTEPRGTNANPASKGLQEATLSVSGRAAQ